MVGFSKKRKSSKRRGDREMGRGRKKGRGAGLRRKRVGHQEQSNAKGDEFHSIPRKRISGGGWNHKRERRAAVLLQPRRSHLIAAG